MKQFGNAALANGVKCIIIDEERREGKRREEKKREDSLSSAEGSICEFGYRESKEGRSDSNRPARARTGQEVGNQSSFLHPAETLISALKRKFQPSFLLCHLMLKTLQTVVHLRPCSLQYASLLMQSKFQ